MTIAWKEYEDGYRFWHDGRGASWRYVGDRKLVEARSVDGRAIDVSNEDIEVRTLKAARLSPDLRDAGADAWELRALVAIAAVESGGRRLPIFGDYRHPDDPKVSVPASTEGASPLSVGSYQFTRDTARMLGVSWNDLAKSEAANHTAALRLLRMTTETHGRDFVTSAVMWNAGTVRASSKNPLWGVVTYRPETASLYAAAWNAAARVSPPVGRPSPPASSPPTKPTPGTDSDAASSSGFVASLRHIAFGFLLVLAIVSANRKVARS